MRNLQYLSDSDFYTLLNTNVCIKPFIQDEQKGLTVRQGRKNTYYKINDSIYKALLPLFENIDSCFLLSSGVVSKSLRSHKIEALLA